MAPVPSAAMRWRAMVIPWAVTTSMMSEPNTFVTVTAGEVSAGGTGYRLPR
jgi:hypothetical protein